MRFDGKKDVKTEDFGYKAKRIEERGYQAKKINEGYQPKGPSPSQPKPSEGSTGAVTPKKES